MIAHLRLEITPLPRFGLRKGTLHQDATLHIQPDAPAQCRERLRIVFATMSAQVPDAFSPLQQARRIVVKVGSALLVDAETGRINRSWLETLIEDLLRLRKRNQQVILVSSGAIALGRRELKLAKGPLRLEESQAAAAVGQIRLAHAYKELLESRQIGRAHV